MADRKLIPTPEQQAAITARGGALLVSAAAGSGKTRVLVERLLGYVTDQDAPCDIDEFLVITYTRAAAGELRSRIADEIARRLAEEPGNRHLRRQAALCYAARIDTIHGFCTELLRENAHLAGIAPDFRIADENESALIRAQVLEDVLDARYETIGDAPGFALLADTLSAGRDDSRLAAVVLDAHTKLKSHADPEGWARARLEELSAPPPEDAGETIWGRYLLRDARDRAAFWRDTMVRLQDEARAIPEFEKAYGPSIAATVDSLDALVAAAVRGWDAARACAAVSFPRAGRVAGFEELKGVRTRCRDAMKKLGETFECTSAELFEDMQAVSPAAEELLRLVLDFDAAYAAAKRRRGVVDFSDQEHLAARLLTQSGTGEPTELARAVSRRFKEILVDEYQDCSRVQEQIFRAVSRDGRNIFMVGDVRQSIYRFRLADPTIFIEKYKSYTDGDEDGAPGRRILLSTNFRSRAGVLDAVNFLFENIMSETLGEMAYTQREFLRPGRCDTPRERPDVEIDVLDLSGGASEDEEENPEKTEAEAAHVADRIARMVAEGYPVPDGRGGVRPAGWGDFAILLRSVKDKAAKYARALEDRGIPAALPGSAGFFETMEIAVAVALLSVIDNPMQDVPLLAVLTSPLYGFTPDELARIRRADRDADLYTALIKSAEDDGKCRAFLSQLHAFRLAAPDMSSDRLLWHVYNGTDMLAAMGAQRGGAARRLNLMRLLEFAARCESGGYKGLYGFLTIVRRLIEDGAQPGDGGDGPAGDAVQIMSIHKSKGLEFPIVLLADTAKRFNIRDTTQPLLMHAQLGVGLKRADLARRIEYPTLPRMAVAKKLRREMLSEELRILYVAMTRARERLIITAAFPDARRTLEKLSADAARPMPPEVLEGYSCPAQFILAPALACGADAAAPWALRVVDAGAKADRADHGERPPEKMPADADPEALNALARRMAYVYPFARAPHLPSKLTATELKGRFADFEAAQEAQPVQFAEKRRDAYLRPAFITGRTSLTAAERGTALHLAMQYIHFDACADGAGVRGELLRLREQGFLSARQQEAVDPEKITAFFKAPVGRRILAAAQLHREFKFSLLVRAGDYFEGGGDDEVLFQGVIDCWFEENGALHIVDFKTDRVTAETLQEKTRLYKPQLAAYGRALGRITGQPVGDRLLYFFATGDTAAL